MYDTLLNLYGVIQPSVINPNTVVYRILMILYYNILISRKNYDTRL